MHGGVILFRGTGADALRYVEADRSRADDYYLSGDAGIQYAVLDASGEAFGVRSLSSDEYNGWVDWINPDTGEVMGRPRNAGADRKGSPRFAEMTINGPKSLSIAAALFPDVSDALDAAQQDALAEIQRWLAQHSVTRVGPRGRQEVVPVEHIQIVGITHRTSRAGDPHRHIHMQLGTRVWAAGKWRALDTAAIFKQQGAIRALGTAIMAAHPQLAKALDKHGLTLNPVTGEVVELEPFNDLMSKRGEQVRRNLERFEAEWEAAHPGETMGPVVSARLTAKAWAHERPAKKPTTMREEAAWLTELREAGYDPERLQRAKGLAPRSVDDLFVQEIASRTLDRCAANESAWTRHTVQEHATRIITKYGVRATRTELRDLIEVATKLALEDCFSVLPVGAAAPEHVAHLTSLRVVQVETELRDLITAHTPAEEPQHAGVRRVATELGQRLDRGQLRAAAAVASADTLVIVEGAAGAGKTTMLATAIRAAEQRGGKVRVVAPTRRAATVAQEELGVPAESVASLVYDYGWRWNSDGAWSRLALGDVDPKTGVIYSGAPKDSQLRRGERIVVDEAGMLNQDTALALFTVAAETGATVALVGDRAQLAAVGRGGVLDIAAQIRGRTFDMAEVHRFTDPAYAELSVQMRDRRNPGEVFDQLHEHNLVRLHSDSDGLREHVATTMKDGEAITVASNDEAAKLNDRIRDERISNGAVDDTMTATGRDGLSIGQGDLIQTRQNNTKLGVANRQQWIVQQVDQDGSLWVRDARSNRKRERSIHLAAEYVTQHAHLTYAATAYGVQGVTVPASHTVLSEQMSGAAVYVGMTRGRGDNTLHIVAEDMADARAQFIEAMERDRADRGLADATARATEAVQGLVADGPVKLVNDEIARLTHEADRAERVANRWLGFAERLTQQRTAQQAENTESAEVVRTAETAANRARAEAVASLVPQAVADGETYLTALEREQEATRHVSTVGRLGRRKARQEHRDATERARTSGATTRASWGSTPKQGGSLTTWATEVADRRADSDSQVVKTSQRIDAAQADHAELRKRHEREHLALVADELGAEWVRRDPIRARFIKPEQEAERFQEVATAARAEAETLRTLTPEQAAARVEARRAQAELARQRLADRARRPHSATEHAAPRTEPYRDSPGLRM